MALRLIAPCVQMRDQVVKSQQEQDTDPEPGKRREERQLSHPRGLFHRGNQQTPHGGRHHHAGSKAGQNALHGVAELRRIKNTADAPSAVPRNGIRMP